VTIAPAGARRPMPRGEPPIRPDPEDPGSPRTQESEGGFFRSYWPNWARGDHWLGFSSRPPLRPVSQR
jgi:hypothetical protein